MCLLKIVGGNPARQIKKRFSDENIEASPAIKWRNWDIGKINRHLDDIVKGDLNLSARDHTKRGGDLF
ncbi:hypothetical protein CHCC20335_2131 [Bacillus paralicheniformis]|uniref:Chloramphenicol O-acetyltransferase n=1 Tax=Bacillus sonorensis L12 TaxID=1274524 RepID=M5PCD4_9BACI|nr:Chloramphenicol O-acetyltransferase [Bacillus sonorensis L12]TWK73846.1 hypothetical protein CHCC20335_2131 [Bacillus paralicheniformis]